MGNLHFTRRGGLIAAAVAASLGILPAAHAVDFNLGDARGSWDTTFSYGQAWRLKDRDCNLIATADGGCGRSPNIDDGDLNYDPGVVSKAFKAVSELSLQWNNVGAFVRGSALYDIYNKGQIFDRIPYVLAPAVKSIVSQQVEQIAVPAWAFEGLGRPVEDRKFRYADMIYNNGASNRQWGRNSSVPDVSRPETQLYFYFQAVSYIDAGAEAIHFGQVELLNAGPPAVVFQVSLPPARRRAALQILNAVQDARQELAAPSKIDQ